jgi:flagellar motility protein MotE (MotC chaperone)
MTFINVPRWLKSRRSLVLPLATAGLAALLPWRAADLLQQWHSLSPIAPAVAQSAPPPAQAPATDPAPRPAVSDSPQAADGRLLLEVVRRKSELDRRERDLQTRAAQVAAAEQLERQQIAELKRLRQEVETLAAREFAAAEADLNLLVGLYSNMKPNQAAAVLGKLDPPKAAVILQHLDTCSAGPILAGMEPKAALAITEELEQRHAPFRR